MATDAVVQTHTITPVPGISNDAQMDFNPVWLADGVTGYIIMNGDMDGTVDRVWYHKTTDGGETWGAAVEIDSGVSHQGMWCIWADIWTQGDSGTLIHIWLADSDAAANGLIYWNLDTSDDSVSSTVTVLASSTFTPSNASEISGVKARGGNLYVQYKQGTSAHQFFGSTDAGASWSELADGGENGLQDHFVMQPGNETDTDDVWLIYLDETAMELSLKTYDQSLDSWSEVSIATSVDTNNKWNQLSAAPRFSDNHSIAVMWNAHPPVSTADLLAFDIGGSGDIDTLTAVETNLDLAAGVGVCVDQNNDDIHVVFGLAEASIGLRVSVVTRSSTDNGTTWSSRTTISNSLSSDVHWVFGGMSINNTGFIPSWLMATIAEIRVGVASPADPIGVPSRTNVFPTVIGLSYRKGAEVGAQTVERPRGMNDGDFMMMFIQCDQDGGAVDIDTPTGWTVIYEQLSNTSTQRNAAMICWKFVTITESATYTITCTNSGQMVNIIILHFIDVSGTPVHVDEFDNAQSPDIPAITTTLNDCLVVRGGLNSEGIISSVIASHTWWYGEIVSNAGIGIQTIPLLIAGTLALQDIIGGISPDDVGFSIALLGGGFIGPRLGTLSVCYAPRFGGACVEQELLLRMTSIREKIETKAMALNVPDLENEALALNYAQITFTIKGTISTFGGGQSGPHVVHPDVVLHYPDLIDLEEIAVLWNRGVPENLIVFTLPLVSGVRSYRGVIQHMTIVENPGSDLVDFVLVFAAAWNVGVPAFRGWA